MAQNRATTVIKQMYFLAASQSLLLKRRLDYLQASGATIVLNLHRVAPPDMSTYRPLEPKFFDELISFCCKHFRITNFSNLDTAYNKAQLILSFDDGYLDFYDNVLPIIGRKKLPVNQNVIPGCVESGLPPLNVVAQDFLGQAPSDILARTDVPGFGMKLTPAAGQALSNFIKFMTAEDRQALSPYLLKQFFSWEKFKPTPMMAVSHLQEIKDVVELGAHSYHHDSLGVESDNFAENDACQCKVWFQRSLALDPLIYAFPNGSYNETQVNRIRQQGFTQLLRVSEALNSRSQINTGVFNRLTFDASSSAEVRFRATAKRELIRQ
jgi:peptidoglycan/xylan/chitin deacetylase (PgdA/CDA1 family)